MNSSKRHSVGSMRYIADIRQLAALLMLTGFCAIIQPIGNVVTLIAPDGGTPKSGIPFSSLFGGLCLITIGFWSILVGFHQTVHDRGSKWLTGPLLLFTQSAFIPYITDMTNIGKIASSGSGFFGAGFGDEVSSSDVRFVGAMGILGVVAYGFTFVGSISFMQFSLYAYQAGKPQDRNASYYRGRQTFYCGMLLLAGFVQLLLGSYLASNFGGAGRLEQGTVGVAMFVVNYPAISIFVGLVQILNAIWGLARSYGVGIFGENDMSYQVSIYIGWFLQILLQDIVQVGIAGPLPAAAGIVAVSFGLNLMPAYLDYKARTVPPEIEPSYYGDGVEKEQREKDTEKVSDV